MVKTYMTMNDMSVSGKFQQKHFEENIETTECGYFSEFDLPELATEKNNEEQVRMCFDAYHSEDWETQFD